MNDATPIAPEPPPTEAEHIGAPVGGVPLVFFHIGKTGGTSLVNYFCSLARQSSVPELLADRSGIDAALRGANLDFVSGHFPIAELLPELPPDWRTMTLIRNPLRHLPSCYWHLRTHDIEGAPPELRQLIEACKSTEFGDLLQSDHIPAFESFFDNPQTRAVLGRGTGLLSDRDLDHAIELLSRLSFVGITERIQEFAVQVAVNLPWAAERRDRAVQLFMTNPHNNSDVYEMPRRTLEQIIARTGFDTELYRHAARIRHSRPVPADALTPEVQIARPPIAVADLIRVSPLVLGRARLGKELRIAGNEVLLHPPPATEGHASVVIDNVPLSGHGEIAGQLAVAHLQAKAVHFSMELSQKTTRLMIASFLVRPGHPVGFRLRIDPAYGAATLSLQTEMEAGAPNGYAWATFIGLTIS